MANYSLIPKEIDKEIEMFYNQLGYKKDEDYRLIMNGNNIFGYIVEHKQISPMKEELIKKLQSEGFFVSVIFTEVIDFKNY